jgi:hypothetical protein
VQQQVGEDRARQRRRTRGAAKLFHHHHPLARAADLAPGAPIIFALFCLRSLPSAVATGVMVCLIGHAVRSTLIFMVLSATIAAVVGFVLDRIVYENGPGMIVFSLFAGIDIIAAAVAALFWRLPKKRAVANRLPNTATCPTGTGQPAFCR